MKEKESRFIEKDKTASREAAEETYEHAQRKLQQAAAESPQPKHPTEESSPEYEGKEPAD